MLHLTQFLSTFTRKQLENVSLFNNTGTELIQSTKKNFLSLYILIPIFKWTYKVEILKISLQRQLEEARDVLKKQPELGEMTLHDVQPHLHALQTSLLSGTLPQRPSWALPELAPGSQPPAVVLSREATALPSRAHSRVAAATSFWRQFFRSFCCSGNLHNSLASRVPFSPSSKINLCI